MPSVSSAYVYTSTGGSVANSSKMATNMKVVINGTNYNTVVYGDVNCDGLVDVSDKTLVNSYIAGNTTLTAIKIKAADVNFDGVIDIADTVKINYYILNGLGSIQFIGITDNSGGHEHTLYMSTCESHMNNLNYSITKNTDINKSTALSKLQSGNVFAIRTHGSASSVTVSGGSVLLSDINALSSGALSGSRLVYYGACLTGAGGASGTNLVNATYTKGAKTVIGFTTTVYCNTTNTWTNQFFKSLGNGEKISQAFLEADYKTYQMYSSDAASFNTNRLVRGNTGQMVAQLVDANFNNNLDDNITSKSKSNDYSSNLNINKENTAFIANEFGYIQDVPVATSKNTTLTSIQRKTIAEEELSKYMNIDNYKFMCDNYVEDTQVYILKYSKFINDYETSDSGFVMLDKSGNIIAICVNNINTFDSLKASTVSEKEINEKAKVLINKKETNDAEFFNYFITLDENDKVIMQVSFESEEGEIDSVNIPLESK